MHFLGFGKTWMAESNTHSGEGNSSIVGWERCIGACKDWFGEDWGICHTCYPADPQKQTSEQGKYYYVTYCSGKLV